MKLDGEGEVKTIVKTRKRWQCDGCDALATEKHTYLDEGHEGARNNPNSSAYKRDDCSWCSDYDQYLCSNCDRLKFEAEVPEGYRWCSTFDINLIPHLFLYWREEEVKSHLVVQTTALQDALDWAWPILRGFLDDPDTQKAMASLNITVGGMRVICDGLVTPKLEDKAS